MAKTNKQTISRAQLFSVLRALNPEVKDLEDFIKQRTRKTDLPVVFLDPKKLEFKWRKTIATNGRLVGIDIGSYVIFSRGFSDPENLHQNLTVGDIRKVAETLHPEAKPLGKKQFDALRIVLEPFKETAYRLRKSGYEVASLPNVLMPIEESYSNELCFGKGYTIDGKPTSKDPLTISFFDFLFYVNVDDLY